MWLSNRAVRTILMRLIGGEIGDSLRKGRERREVKREADLLDRQSYA